MQRSLGLSSFILTLLRKLLYLWVRTKTLPQDLTSLGIDPSKPVVYVLQQRFLSNALVLAQETIKLGLPPAWQVLTFAGFQHPRSFFFLSGNKANARGVEYSPVLGALIDQATQHAELDVQIVPVTILWGRAPDDQNSILKILFADGWSQRGRLRQSVTIMLHGRQTMVRFSQPVSLRELLDQGLSPTASLRKLSRVLRIHFRRQREIAIGPDLSHRRNQVEALLAAPKVVAAISQDAFENGNDAKSFAKARHNSRVYAMEIAADYSYPVILIFARFMQWVWNRIYDGVEVHNLESVTNLAQGNEIIYVPCHRSHIDYLLMSYILYQQGLMVPHIAAGANLNIPVVGGILRRSGAFFLRRSFKGNKVYAAVFNEYLHMMISTGHPIEYFVEGGRSRSGRLLMPMGGMLAMTVQSFLRNHNRPIIFMPVYIGYEKLFEGRTYVGELMGQPKAKENLLDLLLTVRELKKNFGKVHVNFGAPIHLASVLSSAHPTWREEIVLDDEKPAWLVAGIDILKAQIADNINAAAVVQAVNLVSLALLATPKQAMDETRLQSQLDSYRKLALAHPYDAATRITELDGAGMIAYCEKLKLVVRQPHVLGDILYFLPEEAVLASYARNNILHLYALPSLLACLFAQNASLTHTQLLRLAHTIYPFLRAELFIRWPISEIENALLPYLNLLIDMKWLNENEGVYSAAPVNTDEFAQLFLLGQSIRPSLMRYFITLAMLTQLGSGKNTPAELEGLCHLQAQRLSMLREFNAPEFFDKVVFRTLVSTLSSNGLATIGEDGMIYFDQSLEMAANDARYVLPPDVRQAIQHMTRSDTGKAQALAHLAVKKKT